MRFFPVYFRNLANAISRYGVHDILDLVGVPVASQIKLTRLY